jgi:ABC-type nitrate/sulfonate/bicarbonate transport system substrate-binding protein
MSTVRALKKFGYDPNELIFKDVGPGMKSAVLVSGAADVAFASGDDTLRLKQKGYNPVLKVSDIAPSLSQGLGIHVKKLKENRAQLKKVLRATLKGLIFTRNQKKDVVNFMVSVWGKDRSNASESYDDEIGYFTVDGTVPLQLIENVVNEGKEVGVRIIPGITPDKIVDFSLLKEVQKELGL